MAEYTIFSGSKTRSVHPEDALALTEGKGGGGGSVVVVEGLVRMPRRRNLQKTHRCGDGGARVEADLVDAVLFRLCYKTSILMRGKEGGGAVVVRHTFRTLDLD